MRHRAGCFRDGLKRKTLKQIVSGESFVAYEPKDSQRALSKKLTVSPTGGEVMTSRTWGRTPISLALAIAILCTYSVVGLAQTGQTGPTGDLSVVGEVSVNGTSAISGATVFSDSTVTTAKGSSAVVSLGKLGRVELLPGTTMKISFTDTSITGM